MKFCLFCAEPVQDAATVCKRCQADVVWNLAVPERRPLFDEVFNFGDVKDGEWYMCAVCSSCQYSNPVVHMMRGYSAGCDDSMSWSVQCDKCGSSDSYKWSAFVRRKASGTDFIKP